jgi:type I restriction enzyme S subunit
MFTGLSKYEATRPDEFWSTAVPVHWQVVPGIAVITENKARNTGLTESQVLSLSYGRVVVKPVEKQRGLVPDSYEGYQVLDPGDIVIRPTDLQNDQRSIRVGRVRDRGIITSAYIGLRSKQPWTTDYAYLYLTAVDSTKRIYGMGSGLRQQLGWPDLKRMPCLVPPVDEQAAIVKYLAHANARIDKAISAKRRLISLVGEQQRFIANELVTRGLDDEPLRQTGLAWLPEVPRGWDVAPLKRFWNVVDCKHLTVPFVDEGIPLASVSQAQRFYLDLSDARQTDLASYEQLIAGGRTPQRGDLVYCRNVGVGNAAVVDTDERFAMGQDVCLLRSRGHNPVFLNHFLRSDAMRAQLELLLVGSTFRRINVEDVRALTILMPSVEMQRRVVAAIERELRPLDAVVAKEEREVALLQEFRTRLVADVVTGQADVREIARTLSDMALDAPTVDRVADVDELNVDEVMEMSEV